MPPSETLPIVQPFSEIYSKKKKKPSFSPQKERSTQLKVLEQSSNKEPRVLTRSQVKGKEKLIASPTVEMRVPSQEIHVTKSKVELLKEIDLDVPVTIIQKKRKLILPTSSSSSSHCSAPSHHEEATSSKQPTCKRGKNIPIYYPRTPYTRPKNKLRLNSKLIDNPKLKDLVINVDESSPVKGKKKVVSRSRVKPRSKGNAGVKGMDGLALLSTAMDKLN